MCRTNLGATNWYFMLLVLGETVSVPQYIGINCNGPTHCRHGNQTLLVVGCGEQG